MTFGRDETASAARKRVLEVLDDGDKHPIGDVVDAVVNDTASTSTACEAVADMFRQGEVYEPEPGFVRKTSTRGDR